MEGYHTSISVGVLDVLNDICTDEPHLYTFSKTALQPIRILNYGEKTQHPRRRLSSWSWLRPDVGSKKPLTARWNDTDLIVNIWHLLEFLAEMTRLQLLT